MAPAEAHARHGLRCVMPDPNAGLRDRIAEEFHRGDFAAAATLAEELVGRLERASAPANDVALALHSVATARRRLGELDEAWAAATRCAALWESLGPSEHRNFLGTVFTMAEICRAWDMPADATSLYRRVIHDCQQITVEAHEDAQWLDALTGNALQGLAAAQFVQEQPEDGIASLEAALRLFVAAYEGNEPLLRAAAERIAADLESAGVIERATAIRRTYVSKSTH